MSCCRSFLSSSISDSRTFPSLAGGLSASNALALSLTPQQHHSPAASAVGRSAQALPAARSSHGANASSCVRAQTHTARFLACPPSTTLFFALLISATLVAFFFPCFVSFIRPGLGWVD